MRRPTTKLVTYTLPTIIECNTGPRIENRFPLTALIKHVYCTMLCRTCVMKYEVCLHNFLVHEPDPFVSNEIEVHIKDIV